MAMWCLRRVPGFGAAVRAVTDLPFAFTEQTIHRARTRGLELAHAFGVSHSMVKTAADYV